MNDAVIWGEFLQSDWVRYGLAAAVLVFSKLVGLPLLLGGALSGLGLALGVFQLPGALSEFQSYLSGWSLVGMLAAVLAVSVVKLLAGRGRGVYLFMFIVLGALSALNFFRPEALPQLIGDDVAALSLNAFGCLALGAAVMMSFRSAAAAVFAALWLCVAVGFNGEGIIRALPSSWFDGQLRTLVMANEGASDELPRFAMKFGDGLAEMNGAPLVAVLSRNSAKARIIKEELIKSRSVQTIDAFTLDQIPANTRHVVVDLDSVVAFPSASCQPSAVAALFGITPVCREQMRGPGVVCLSATLDTQALAQKAPGVSCDKIVDSVAALRFG